MSMVEVANGLHAAKHFADAVSVREAELSLERRIGESAHNILIVQSNLATSYAVLGRHEQALRVRQEVYSGWLKSYGEENRETLIAANNYVNSLFGLRRFEETRSMVRKTMPAMRRVLGESHEVTLKMGLLYGGALYMDTGATLDDVREAVTTLEDTERIARRVLGGAHPLTESVGRTLCGARARLEEPGS
jgi:hypothetical protein